MENLPVGRVDILGGVSLATALTVTFGDRFARELAEMTLPWQAQDVVDPRLLVLNEPETSLHPDLLPPLARLIAHAAKQSQVLVVSHATRLIAALEREGDSHSIMLEKELGETRIAGLNQLDQPAWRWPAR